MSPRVEVLARGTQLARIYDPTLYGARELTFRSVGPIARFDHHRPGAGDVERRDPERGIWHGSYGEKAVRACAYEVFGTTWRIELQPRRIALPTVARPLRLLDLRGEAALDAGVTAELAKWPDLRMTWAWSRHFHSLLVDGEPVDGLVYESAWSGLACVALYERAAKGLDCDAPCSFPLTEARVRDELLRLASEKRFAVA